ncbi:MAG: metal ABC transporter ATP-binding protein [Treponema sp.]|jgi:zinc transport system ATP-binding protein|nr:metal ABC transporter ATP-binding protein [Treponema sp.]
MGGLPQAFAPIHPIERNICLRFNKVYFAYPKIKVLEGASFHIHQGEFVALVGPNGSGKTTVLKLLLGLETPQSGNIEISGRPASKFSRGYLGYVPQQSQTDKAFPITVRDVVKMGRLRPLSRRFGPEDKAAVEEAMEQAEITELASRLYGVLSGGQRRRVLAARALASRPAILVLDEPTANMDQESETRLYETLGKLKGNTTILIVTHDMDFVSILTDRVLCTGTGAPELRDYSIVQHRVEASRVIHDESIPADACYEK